MRIKIADNDIDIGYILFYFSDSDIGVNFINIIEEYRGLGFGTELLWRVYDYITENNKKVKYICWDDCSDNSRVINNNIYIKVGARYKYKYGPEMVWNIKSRVIKKKRDKYKSKIDMSKYKYIIEM